MKKSFLITIVCDGEFPRAKQPLGILRKAARSGITIACDGAIKTLVKNGFSADYIVGDMDTLSPALQKRYHEKIHKYADQDTNDQTKAFHFALRLIKEQVANQTASQAFQNNKAGRKAGCALPDFEICIVGATGKREDHALGNISHLGNYLQDIAALGLPVGINICMVTDYGTFIPMLSSCEIQGRKGDRISIFAFDNTLKIKSEGLEYKTDRVIFDSLWKATLNKFAGDKVKLHLNHPAVVILYFPF